MDKDTQEPEEVITPANILIIGAATLQLIHKEGIGGRGELRIYGDGSWRIVDSSHDVVTCPECNTPIYTEPDSDLCTTVDRDVASGRCLKALNEWIKKQ